METLFQSFNFGKQETSQIMPYCRISIEKYLYLKLGHLIIPQYREMTQAQDERFREKLLKVTFDSAMKVYGLPALSEGQKTRLEEAVQEVNRITLMAYPREKLRCLQMMNAILKGSCAGFNESYISRLV